MKYLFKLGHQPEISRAEIFSVFDKKDLWCGVADQSEDTLILTAEEIDSKEFMEVLGGTVLIAEKVRVNGEDVVNKIASYLEETKPKGKVEFALSGSGTENLLMPVKNELKDRGRSARFIKIENTASIKYNNLVNTETHLHLYKDEVYTTKAIQPFEKMKKHDRDRPDIDPQSGMLPPKLARILVNLSKTNKDKTVLDTFCGSGTILMEAASMGFKNLIGNDLDEQAIEYTKENLDWIKKEEELGFELKLMNYSVEEISEYISKQVDAIITEPYLGEPRDGTEKVHELKDRVNKLRRIYIDAFYEFIEITKKDSVVVFILPRFKTSNGWIRVKCIEEIKDAGFGVVPFEDNKSLFYAREDQLVGREIWKFRKV